MQCTNHVLLIGVRQECPRPHAWSTFSYKSNAKYEVSFSYYFDICMNFYMFQFWNSYYFVIYILKVHWIPYYNFPYNNYTAFSFSSCIVCEYLIYTLFVVFVCHIVFFLSFRFCIVRSTWSMTSFVLKTQDTFYYFNTAMRCDRSSRISRSANFKRMI